MIFYKNGILQYQMMNNTYFPNGDCYFIVELDDKMDQFYIEQGYKPQCH